MLGCVVLRFCLFVLRVLLWFVVSAFLSGFEDKVYLSLFMRFLFLFVYFFIIVIFVYFWVYLSEHLVLDYAYFSSVVFCSFWCVVGGVGRKTLFRAARALNLH